MSEGIRIEISCWNSKCKHYWEDMCLKEWRKNQVMFHDKEGKCQQFEEGVNECYLEEGQDESNREL